jgi:PTS system ascorbate-specific IIB component
MSRALKILVVCGNGMGSSLLVKMSLEEILADLNIYGIVDGTSVSQAAGMMYNADLVITSTAFFVGLERSIPEGKPVITCKNIFDKVELRKKVQDFLKIWNPV